jgi:hypothetical protein
MSKKQIHPSVKEMMTAIEKLHAEWALDNGYLVPSDKHQAASIKQEAADLNAEVYTGSDYRATSIKRQALTKIPHN